MMQRLLTVAVAAALLTGCSGLLAPAYQRPAAPVPAAWPTGPAYDKALQPSDKTAADIGWRSFILDARLQKLVEKALANNRDLRVAALNIEKARAQYGISRADMFPTISATGAGTHTQTATDVTTSGTPRITHTYTANVGFSSYELDFFGKIQNQMDEAKETWLEYVETRNASQITLISEVASDYLTLAADQDLLKLAQDTLKSQQETFRLTQREFETGVASMLDVSAAQASVEAARIDVATYTTSVAQAENALAVIIGGAVPDDLRPPLGLLDGAPLLQDVPAGLSSEVLLRRPDLRADEHALKSANASIGAARAAFFPSITLTATAGSASNDMSRLFKGGNDTWNFMPQISIPIFSGGSLMASLDVAKVTRDIQVATYEKDIQTAFQEVANALAQRGTIGDQLRAQQSQTNAYAKSYQLSEVRYKNGIDSYLSLLTYQRSYYSAQQSLISTKLTQQSNLVTLYKVLGGGLQE
jgi:multidrug efflux system outer membrane protein